MKTKDTKSSLAAKPHVDLILVTMDNAHVFEACLRSILSFTSEPFRLIIVNNGKPETLVIPGGYPYVQVVQMPENKGWMGGVNAGIEAALLNTDSEFVCWMNDDVQILDHDYGWLTKMIHAFHYVGGDKGIGAVGPMSNRVMGYQNSGYIGLPPVFEATRLSGMCFLTKKEIVREIGVLDETLPGGDDLDYSIRLRKAGYRLAVARRSFMLHHQGVTGRKVHGSNWDSVSFTEDLNNALIKKHGFEAWFNCTRDVYGDKQPPRNIIEAEEELALKYIQDELHNGVVLDLGCGGKKIHPKVVGVDFRANGERGAGSNVWHPAATEIQCDATTLDAFEDASVDAIIAKHLLEHIMDIPKTLAVWRRKLKPSGKLVIVCPDWRFCEAMACDPTHVHAFTPESCKTWLELLGFKVLHTDNVERGWVFSITAEAVPIQAQADSRKLAGVA